MRGREIKPLIRHDFRNRSFLTKIRDYSRTRDTDEINIQIYSNINIVRVLYDPFLSIIVKLFSCVLKQESKIFKILPQITLFTKSGSTLFAHMLPDVEFHAAVFWWCLTQLFLQN